MVKMVEMDGMNEMDTSLHRVCAHITCVS